MKRLLFSASESLAIASGGALGSICRALVDRFSPDLGAQIPALPPSVWVNLPGTVLLAGLHLAQDRFREPVPFFAMVGFCGSFTTVSSFSLEVILQLQSGGWPESASSLLFPIVSACVLVAFILRWSPDRP